MFKLRYTSEAKRQLKKISKLLEQRSIKEALEDIKSDPKLGKPLKDELKGKLSYRIGNFRIIYIVNWQDQIITLLTADHRSTVYQ